MLSYGLTNNFDLVSYYSDHYNGTISSYFGVFNQFYRSKKLDLGTGIGYRKIIHKKNQYSDFFFPQFLFNYKLINNYSFGGSVVSLIDTKNLQFKGTTIELALYIPITKITNSSEKIKETYLSIGLFKNSTMDIRKDLPYIHYSIDFIFDIKN